MSQILCTFQFILKGKNIKIRNEHPTDIRNVKRKGNFTLY